MQQFDEMYSQAAATTPGSPVREHYKAYAEWLAGQTEQIMLARREEAEMIFRRVGITFAVYGDKDESGSGTERLIPFDLIPITTCTMHLFNDQIFQIGQGVGQIV